MMFNTVPKNVTPTDPAACAHIHVAWRAKALSDGSYLGTWACVTCETEFVPMPALEAEVAELRVELALQTEHSITSWLVDAFLQRGFKVELPYPPAPEARGE